MEALQIDESSASDVDHLKNRDIQAPSHAPSPQHVLASTASAVVVTVKYRLGAAKQQKSLDSSTRSPQGQNESPDQALGPTSPQPETYKYPTPVHDTLTGFDWIKTNLNPSKLGICGTHIGGSLALMLSLTEAQSINAVAATNPICDWPSLDEYCTTENTNTDTDLDPGSNGKLVSQKPKRHSRKKTAPTDLVPLLEARSKFFTTPEKAFDSFASPILFLRSAGRDVPRTFPRYLTGPEYPVPVLQNTRTMTAAEAYDAAEGSLWDRDVYPDGDGDEVNDLVGTVTRRRKALSRWPPYGLDYGVEGKRWSGPHDGIGRLEVTLPFVRVFTGEGVDFGGEGGVSEGVSESSVVRRGGKGKEGSFGNTVRARQAEEMVSVMRRACFWGREKGFGERRVVLSRALSGVDQSREVGEWFRDVFDGTMDEVD
ncbi:hypothetical protein PENANT_c016G11837 [Penicillium antarcticum]|uniref:Uncharacterized protein n=1 Tax=Penicillium antarcticum TaxID=416450 RepID=A0A1V6Q2L6_9EURO|nr:uncharacterized protein N7508_001322 [Penicillium antarcticum]KAJ5316814.1 hypothetical protein N7508_001322 [Penicillium antarcticum]OQD83518.1 hypothetical protein PENANT_c016G11837 [Penicillium antarcticum]